MNLMPFLWGFIGGIVYEAGLFAAAVPLALFASHESRLATFAVARVAWGALCCAMIGRLAAGETVRHRWASLLASALGFAVVASAPPTGTWYSVAWLECAAMASVMPATFILVGYMTHWPTRCASFPRGTGVH